MHISEKSRKMGLSPIRRFNEMAHQAELDGKKVYRLNIGQPDIETPECYMEAIKNYDEKVIAYMESAGTEDILDSIASYYQSYGMDYTRDDIIVTTGGSEALSMVFCTILDEGDEVLCADPYYSNYRTFVLSAGGEITPIKTDAEDGYHYADREKLEQSITLKTRAIACVSPGNPTGSVLSLDEMKLICEIAKEHDLWVIADEVYREILFDGREISSFGMLPEYSDRVIITDSVSKRYSACGARIGMVVSKNRDLMDGIMKIAQGRLCVSTIDQIGAAALFKLDKPYYDSVRDEYQDRRDIVYEELMKIPGVICKKPAGALYVMVKMPVDDIEDFLVFMLKDFDDNGETVMFAPADGFYKDSKKGKDKMRLAYVLRGEELRRSVELIRLGLTAYKKKIG